MTTQHPYAEQEARAKARIEEARQNRDAARKQAKDFEVPWGKNTDTRIKAEQNLLDAKTMTPLGQIIEWQSTVNAALHQDAKFRAEFELLHQAAVAAEDNFKRARHDYEDVRRNIEIWRNEQADLRNARLEAEIEAEVRATRERLREAARLAA